MVTTAGRRERLMGVMCGSIGFQGPVFQLPPLLEGNT
jgi:hypothetical protein